MSSIKEALEAALKAGVVKPATPTANIPPEWDDEGAPAPVTDTSTTSKENPMPAKLFGITNNVSRETFNHIANNPGITRRQLMADMSGRGYKDSSVSALLAQMHKQGMIGGGPEGMHALVKEYRPLKSSAAIQRQKKMKAELRAQRKAKAKTKDALPAPATEADSWSPEDILKELSVLRARALYDALGKLFNA